MRRVRFVLFSLIKSQDLFVDHFVESLKALKAGFFPSDFFCSIEHCIFGMTHSQSLKLESSADAEKLITGDLFWSGEDHGKERLAEGIESVKLFVGFISVATSE